MRAVLDASAFVDDLLFDRAHGVDLVDAPTTFDIEALSAVRKAELRGLIDAHEAADVLSVWSAMNIRRHGIRRLASRMWHFRHDITPADASYVALAEALGVPLVTADRRLARTAARYCDVIVPG